MPVRQLGWRASGSPCSRAHMQIRHTQLVERGRKPRVDVGDVGLPHVVVRVGRRHTDTDPVRADRIGNGGGNLDDEPDAVGGRATVAVGALVAAGGQELVEQVAVGGVQLDAVEAGGDGAPGRGGELGDDAGDLVGVEGARLRGCGRAVDGEDLRLGLDRGRRDRGGALGQQALVRPRPSSCSASPDFPP